jgi:cyclic dehypoxanthinyl futalosine synthase
MLEEIYHKVKEGISISREEGLFVLKNAELLDLGDLANEIRFKKNPKLWVTYLLDTNPNYSNVCNVDCIFCAFYRHDGEKGAYRLSVDQLISSFKEAAAKGITTVLLQGGVDPAIPFEYYLELVERTIKEVPEIFPHFFSTSEIIGMSQVSGLKVREVLEILWEKGLRSLPGGGAEILSDRVKRKISNRKGTSAD